MQPFTFVFVIVLIIQQNWCDQQVEVSLNDDPSLFPGHLEPLGSKQSQTEIEELTEYPSPEDFFANYIKPGRPFLLKKGAVNQQAFKLWTDEYMASFPKASEELVQVEPNKKENREAQGFEIPLKEFISRYPNEKIYMVNKVPTFLQKDVLMPPPLRCNTTRSLMLDHVTWMSSGGTKSVVHNDDLDNINCLFRGTKELLFIDPKFKNKVPMDNPRGGYSSLDVDKVNFTKYPDMREVEYVHCGMVAGDCLFIPYRWIHQVNSVADENQQNIAVNIWFKHDAEHKPELCDLPDEKTSIDNWKFVGMENAFGDEDENSEPYPLISLMEYVLTQTKFKRANLKTFTSLLMKIQGIFIENSIEHLTPSKDFLSMCDKLFKKLNFVEDKYLKKDDFAPLEKEDKNKLENWLNDQFDEMQVILTKDLAQQPKMDDETDESITDGENEEKNVETPTTTDEDDHKKTEL